MPLYQVLVLAIVQSVTEFLPISSTAHLALAPWLLGWKDPGLTFDIALHLGTLAAIVIYFFRDWVQLIASGLRLPYQRDADSAGIPGCSGCWPWPRCRRSWRASSSIARPRGPGGAPTSSAVC